LSRSQAQIEQLLREGELERVALSPALAQRLLDEVNRHLGSAELVSESDPTGAFELAYDGARKACAALLAVQGLPSTTRGGHVAKGMKGL
jgi:hypothetical protein